MSYHLIDFACRLFADEADSNLDRWLEQMREQGPDHIVAQALLPNEIKRVIAAAESDPGNFTAHAAFDPRDSEVSFQVIQALAQRDLHGALLFPGVHGFRLDDERLAGLFEVAGSNGSVITVHCGMPPAVLRDLPGAQINMLAANPLELIPIADRHPEIPFIIPSFGAGFFRELLIAGDVCENIHTSSAGSGAWLRTQSAPMTLEDVIERSIGVFGAERVLFATGSSSTTPGWRSDLATLQREAMGALEMKPADMAQILAGNALRLLDLSSPTD